MRTRVPTAMWTDEELRAYCVSRGYHQKKAKVTIELSNLPDDGAPLIAEMPDWAEIDFGRKGWPVRRMTELERHPRLAIVEG